MERWLSVVGFGDLNVWRFFFVSGDGVYLERWFYFFLDRLSNRGSEVASLVTFDWYVITSDHIWLSFSHLFLSAFPSFQDSRG